MLRLLEVDVDIGLTPTIAAERLTEYGPNALRKTPPLPAWRISAQFSELVVLILIGAAVIAGLLGEWPDSLAILAIVVLNGVIGFLQEHRAERMWRRPSIGDSDGARIRDGGCRPFRLATGARRYYSVGGGRSGSGRLSIASNVWIENSGSALTGESVPGDKDADAVLAFDTPLGDRKNMVYLGTTVAAGKTQRLSSPKAWIPSWGTLPAC